MSITGLLVTILVIVAGIYDLGVVVYGYWTGKSTTTSVSNFLIKAGLKSPFLVFSFGFVFGHLFGVMYPETCPPPSANILAPNFWMGLSATWFVAWCILWRKNESDARFRNAR